MRILIATPCLCWPLHNGGNAAQFSTLRCLSEDHDFVVVVPIWNEELRNHARELAIQLPRVKVRGVYLGSTPQPVSWNDRVLRGAADLVRRGRRKLRGKKSSDDIVAPESAPAPYNPFLPLPAAYIAALAEEIQTGVDLCQAEFAETMQLGAWFPPTLPRLFIHHQIHTIYAERFAATHGHLPYIDYLIETMRTQERAYLRHFDGVVAFSEHDRRTLETFVPADRAFASAFPVPFDVGIAAQPAAAWNGRVVFIGSEDHPPNVDALGALLDDIWPRIADQLPEARLVVIGRWSQAWRQRGAHVRVEFSGFVADLPKALRGAIMLVPLRIGSGIRTKILVALAQGVPTVTTTIGGEGLPLTDGVNALVRDDAKAMAEGVVQLAQDPARWSACATAGLTLARQHFSPEQVRIRRNEIYTAVAAKHRAPSTTRPL